MPFSTITAQTVAYEPRIPGTYSKSGLLFSDPSDDFLLRGATKAKDGSLRASVSRKKEVDVVVGGVTLRKLGTATLSIVVPDIGVTPAIVDSLVSDIAEFMTAVTASRLLQGES